MNPDVKAAEGKSRVSGFSLFFFFALIIELLFFYIFISEVAPSVVAVFSASHAAVRLAKRLPPVSHKSVHRQRRG